MQTAPARHNPPNIIEPDDDLMRTAPTRHNPTNIIEPDDAKLSDDNISQSDTEASDQVADNETAKNNNRKVEEIPQDEDYLATSDQAELLRWHYRLGHVSFFKLRTINGFAKYNSQKIGICKISKMSGLFLW